MQNSCVRFKSAHPTPCAIMQKGRKLMEIFLARIPAVGRCSERVLNEKIEVTRKKRKEKNEIPERHVARNDSLKWKVQKEIQKGRKFVGTREQTYLRIAKKKAFECAFEGEKGSRNNTKKIRDREIRRRDLSWCWCLRNYTTKKKN